MISNMAKVRNYIRDNIGKRYLVMCDDDIKVLGLWRNRNSKLKFYWGSKVVKFDFRRSINPKIVAPFRGA